MTAYNLTREMLESRDRGYEVPCSDRCFEVLSYGLAQDIDAKLMAALDEEEVPMAENITLLETHEAKEALYHFDTRFDPEQLSGEVIVSRDEDDDFNIGPVIYRHTLMFTPVEGEAPCDTFMRHAKRVRREFIARL